MNSLIPADWSSRTLAECGKWYSGGTPSTTQPAYWNGDIPWITSSSLKSFLIVDSERRVTQLGVENGTRLMPADSVLFVVRGMSLKTEWRVGIAQRPVAFGQDCKAIEVHQDIDPFFLAYVLRSKEHQVMGLVDEASHGTGRLQTAAVESLIIPAPPLSEQRQIVQIFRTWDKAIATVEQLIAALQRRKKGLMQRLLTGQVRFPEFEDRPWPFARAGDIFQPRSKRKNGNEKLLSATQDRGVIPRSMLEARVTMPSGATDGYKLVEQGDFVISLRTFQGGIEYSEYRGIISPAYIVLQPTMPIVTEFYKHLFKSQEFISRLAVAVIGIRDGKQISYDDFASIKLVYPSLDEQERIGQVLRTCDDEIGIQVSRMHLLREQKKGLMQRLLTGQVRVQV